MDVVRLHGLPGFPGLPVPGVLRGLLWGRVQGFTRWVVGNTSSRDSHDVPELGLPHPSPALRGFPLRSGRVMSGAMRTAALQVDVYLTPHDRLAALRHDVAAGLTKTPKELPPKWFYDERGSALFEEITRLPEYYLTRRERDILGGCAREVARVTEANTLIEPGAGSSEKTRLLLDALSGTGRL